MKPSEYVAAVADDLKSNGWTQGAMHDEQGSCVMGAMAHVTLGNLEVFEAGILEKVHQFILSKTGYSSLPAWNDTPGRTLNEVLGFLHECQICLKEAE